jgi:hypothetical protein
MESVRDTLGWDLPKASAPSVSPPLFDDGSNDLKVAWVKFHNLKVILMLANWIK